MPENHARTDQTRLRFLEAIRSGPGWGLTKLPGVAAAHRVSTAVLERFAPAEASVEAFGFTFTVDPRDHQASTELSQAGGYEPAETALFADKIAPGMTVVDVGANMGIYALIAARTVGPTGRVVAFEPVPTTAALLRKTIAVNHFQNVAVEESAVARTSGEAEIFIVDKHSALASLSSFNARSSRRSITVPVVSLDDYFEHDRVDVIKMDAQGAEMQIAEGGRELIERCRPVVFAEVWLAALEHMGSSGASFLSFFDECGYSIATVDDPKQRITVDQTVALATPSGGVDVLLTPSHTDRALAQDLSQTAEVK